jgi:hypothetical protein
MNGLISSMLATLVRSIAISMAVTCAASVAAESQAERSKRQWGDPTESFQIPASTAKETYSPCEAIILSLILKNCGLDDAEIWMVEAFAPTYQIEVLPPRKEKAYAVGEEAI